jgi:hypothetical protein
MGRSNCVVKASNIIYINAAHPGRLEQIAEDYYQKARQYELECSYGKARSFYKKAEGYFRDARDAYKARKQADRAKKYADEARAQADEARKLAGEAREQSCEEIYAPQKTGRRICTSAFGEQVPLPAYACQLTRRQPQNAYPDVKISPKPAAKSVKNEDAAEHQAEIAETPPVISEKNEYRPISWKGKKPR